MAGAGYKLFETGAVLTAADVNTYLNEQTVMVFASATARTTALSGVLSEGMVSYLQDTNAVEVYNGSNWVGVGNVGDITEVQAGVGISIASGTGPIPVITNSSTDLITTAGDLLYGTAADTVARLGIGTAGQVLKVNSGATAPEWGAAAGGDLNWTLLNTGGTALTGAATITVSGISNIDHFLIVIHDGSSSNASSDALIRFNADSGANYYSAGLNILGASTYAAGNLRTFDGWGTSGITVAYGSNNAASKFYGVVKVDGGKSTGIKTHTTRGTASAGGGTGHEAFSSGGIYNASAAITSVSAVCTSGNWDNGTLYVYGA